MENFACPAMVLCLGHRKVIPLFNVAATLTAQHGSHVTQRKAVSVEMDTSMQWFVMLQTKFQLY